ncbi:DUF4189 domain-containing protein [Nocardia sp. CDC159]|uniref:DUF4189 domain-containing protein n=1 Tax=Nocardia pulmonis TaxID=2951408 RepID=A0A9X2IY45_9NOCA|nr:MULTISPECIES: DUF4189 domain-containing protein [Nocardia]MCM6776677.1 DUF4189 domain-containing protein [Nocardia pulmonis]MCM6789174.1 DUF4189 domain-containing protein [Nocardia sp. CDC159]
MSLLHKAAWCLTVPAVGALVSVGVGPAGAAPGDLYGAMALSSSTGTVAYAVDYTDRIHADAGANVKCGVYDCHVVLRFVNACGAVAQGADHRFGWASAPTKVEAERAAVESLGLSAPPFPDLGSASPRAAEPVLSVCTANAD